MCEIEAIVGSIADLARVEVQRSDLVASELIVLLKHAADRLHSSRFSMCDLTAVRTNTMTVKTFPRNTIRAEDLSDLARICLARMKGQVEKRIATASAETVLILLLDPRTKFSVESLVQPLASTGETSVAGKDDGQAKLISEVVAAGNKLFVDAHRDMFASLNSRDSFAVNDESSTAAPNFGLIPSADDEKVICGAAVQATAPHSTPSPLPELADKVLEDWRQYTVDWISVAVLHSSDETKSADDFIPLRLVRHNGAIRWRVEAVCEHVDILRWFRVVGSARFPSIAALARIWLGRAPSNAFQERVFSTGGIVMSNRRSRTDNCRAEMQVLFKQNKNELRLMEADTDGKTTLQDHII